jgi:hypothetical protein
LPDSAAYSIDARSKMGQVMSDSEGTGRVQHFLGHRFVSSVQSPAKKLYLRTGFGGIAIKRVPPQR